MKTSYTDIQNATDSPEQVNARVLGSIRRYVQDYRDTSLSKLNRKAALASAIILVQYVIEDLNVNIPEDQRAILLVAFKKIHQMLVEASGNFDKIYNLKDVEGFIGIIEL